MRHPPLPLSTQSNPSFVQLIRGVIDSGYSQRSILPSDDPLWEHDTPESANLKPCPYQNEETPS